MSRDTSQETHRRLCHHYVRLRLSGRLNHGNGGSGRVCGRSDGRGRSGDGGAGGGRRSRCGLRREAYAARTKLADHALLLRGGRWSGGGGGGGCRCGGSRFAALSHEEHALLLLGCGHLRLVSAARPVVNTADLRTSCGAAGSPSTRGDLSAERVPERSRVRCVPDVPAAAEPMSPPCAAREAARSASRAASRSARRLASASLAMRASSSLAAVTGG